MDEVAGHRDPDRGRGTDPPGPHAAVRPAGQFWYAYRRTPALWWHRLRENLTPRSVYFQGALRLAAALAVARLLAGVLDLSHGFWVLLTILTVLRTSAAETRSALKPALIGTVAGSLVAAALLIVGINPTAYAVVLPLVMLVGFAAGPLLGLGWAQALFTIVITLVFAQVTPVDWRLAEARVLDVVVGAAIGVLIGLFAWPRGGSGELHRASRHLPRRRRAGGPRHRRGDRERRPARVTRCPAPARTASWPKRRTPSTRAKATSRPPSTGRPRWWPATTPSAAPKR